MARPREARSSCDSVTAASCPVDCTGARTLLREARSSSPQVRERSLSGSPGKETQTAGAWDDDGIIQRALPPRFRAEVAGLMLLTDVLFLRVPPSTGACGTLDGGDTVANDETLDLLVRTAISHVDASADARSARAT